MEEEKQTNPLIEKVYLSVPYEKKNIAKKYGAWWDPQEKRWYAPKKSNGKHFRTVNYDKLYKLFLKNDK